MLGVGRFVQVGKEEGNYEGFQVGFWKIRFSFAFTFWLVPFTIIPVPTYFKSRYSCGRRMEAMKPWSCKFISVCTRNTFVFFFKKKKVCFPNETSKPGIISVWHTNQLWDESKTQLSLFLVAFLSN